MEKVKRAAGYIRVSTTEQSLKGLSIETQIAEIKAYAEYHKMKLEDIYIDRGITARKCLENRVEFMRMMKDVSSGKINHIIVLRLDRFFRNVYDYHRMMNEYLTPNQCDWSAVKEQYTTETTNGRLMINLRLAIAEQECDTDSDRIKDVLAHRAKQGYAISGSVPFGFKIVDKRVVPDEEKRHIVQDFFDLMESHNSIRKTLMHINEKYKTNFTYQTVTRMLKNKLYYGEFHDNENYCEPIITKEQFENVQRLLKMNLKVRKNKYTFKFSGLLVCDFCGRKMAGNGTTYRGYTYIHYRCNKAYQSGLCESSNTINEKDIENYLLENGDSLMEKYIKDSELQEKETKVQKSNRKNIEAKLQRLNELYVNGYIQMEKYQADYAALQELIVDVPKPVKKDLTAVKKVLHSNYKDIYATMSDEEKLALWRSFITEIRVLNKKIVDIKFL